MRDTSVDFTSDELLVLADITGDGTPAGLDEQESADRPDAVREYLRSEARASLVARRIVDDGDSGAQVDEAVATLLRCAAAPGLLVVATVEADGVAETRFYAAEPDLGVEQQPVAPTVHRFIPFPPREILRRATRFADLRPNDEPTVAAFDVTSAQLETAGERIADGDDPGAEDVLVAAGATPDAATAFVAVASGSPRTASVTVFYRPEDDKVAGGSLTWIDGGLDGLWCTEVIVAGDDVDPEDPVIRLTPSTGTAVARELLSYFPPAFAGPTASG